MTKQKQLKYDVAYLKMAKEWAKLSYCKRKQVGALIVKDKMISRKWASEHSAQRREKQVWNVWGHAQEG